MSDPAPAAAAMSWEIKGIETQGWHRIAPLMIGIYTDKATIVKNLQTVETIIPVYIHMYSTYNGAYRDTYCDLHVG